MVDGCDQKEKQRSIAVTVGTESVQEIVMLMAQTGQSSPSSCTAIRKGVS
jgi:hypothetical protein